MSARAVALAAVLIAALPARADTLEWLGARLPVGPGQPWPWRLDGRKPNPGGVPVAEVEKAFQAAYRNWQDVSCAYVAFDYAGRDTAHGPRQPDGVNVMGAFLESRTEDQEFYETALGGGAAVAVSLPLYYGGTIYECDVAFNAVDYGWAVDGNNLRFDVATVASHETGHCLGLDHFGGDKNAAMAPFVSPGELRRGLVAHDIDNVCQLYPQAGDVGSPCDPGGCVGGLTCVGSGPTAFCTRGCDPDAPGVCPIGFSCKASGAVPGAKGACAFGGEGSIKVGAPCASFSDCGTPADVLCMAYEPISDTWDDGYCTADCTGHPCPASSSCYDVAGQRLCLKDCRPGMGDCRAGYACEPLADGKGRCVPACRSDSQCPGGRCDNCDGLCVHAGRPGAAVGDRCGQSSECPTGGLCRKDIAGGTCTLSCATRCSPCPQGSVCQPHPDTGELLCFKSCGGATDCPQGLGCWQDGQGGGCKPPCTSDEECAVGQQCVSGSCLRPEGDGGCALCDDRDAGPRPGPDASVAPEPAALPSGCGCSAGSGLGVAGLLPLALLVVRRRKDV